MKSSSSPQTENVSKAPKDDLMFSFLKPSPNDVTVKQENKENSSTPNKEKRKSSFFSFSKRSPSQETQKEEEGEKKSFFSFMKTSPNDATLSQSPTTEKKVNVSSKNTPNKDRRKSSMFSFMNKSQPNSSKTTPKVSPTGDKRKSSIFSFMNKSPTDSTKEAAKKPPKKDSPTQDKDSPMFSFLKSSGAPTPNEVPSSEANKDSSLFSFMESSPTKNSPKDESSVKDEKNPKRKFSFISFSKRSPSQETQKEEEGEKKSFFSFMKTSPNDATLSQSPTTEKKVNVSSKNTPNKDRRKSSMFSFMNKSQPNSSKTTPKVSPTGDKRKSSIFSFMNKSPTDSTKEAAKKPPKKDSPTQDKDSPMFSFLKSSGAPTPNEVPSSEANKDSSLFSFMESSPTKNSPKDESSVKDEKDPKRKFSFISFSKRSPSQETQKEEEGEKKSFFSFMKTSPNDATLSQSPTTEKKVNVSSKNTPKKDRRKSSMFPFMNKSQPNSSKTTPKVSPTGDKRKSSIFSFMNKSFTDLTKEDAKKPPKIVLIADSKKISPNRTNSSPQQQPNAADVLNTSSVSVSEEIPKPKTSDKTKDVTINTLSSSNEPKPSETAINKDYSNGSLSKGPLTVAPIENKNAKNISIQPDMRNEITKNFQLQNLDPTKVKEYLERSSLTRESIESKVSTTAGKALPEANQNPTSIKNEESPSLLLEKPKSHSSKPTSLPITKKFTPATPPDSQPSAPTLSFFNQDNSTAEGIDVLPQQPQNRKNTFSNGKTLLGKKLESNKSPSETTLKTTLNEKNVNQAQKTQKSYNLIIETFSIQNFHNTFIYKFIQVLFIETYLHRSSAHIR